MSRRARTRPNKRAPWRDQDDNNHSRLRAVFFWRVSAPKAAMQSL